eukprot:gene11215-7787_t
MYKHIYIYIYIYVWTPHIALGDSVAPHRTIHQIFFSIMGLLRIHLTCMCGLRHFTVIIVFIIVIIIVFIIIIIIRN